MKFWLMMLGVEERKTKVNTVKKFGSAAHASRFQITVKTSNTMLPTTPPTTAPLDTQPTICQFSDFPLDTCRTVETMDIVNTATVE